MKRYIFLFIAALFSIFTAFADDVNVVGTAPSVVEMGERFKLEYDVDRKADGIELGQLDGFDVMGPSTSYSSSTSIVNGKRSQQISFKYTFVLTAKKEGNFQVPSAIVKVDGKEYQSNKIDIQVLKGSQPEASAGAASSGNSASASDNRKAGESMFVNIEVNKNSLYIGESLTATVKLYIAPSINMAGFGRRNTFPSFDGFMVEEINSGNDISVERGTYGGKLYNVAEIKKWVLFPQHSGVLTIDPVELECIVRERVSMGNSFFDDIFDNYDDKSLLRKSKPVTVKVKELPAEGKPSDFLGLVGNIQVRSSISSDSVVANDAVTYTLTVSGTGNLKLMAAPKLKLPADFESYEPKVTRDIRTSENGTVGKVIYEYVVIPRFAGKYEIPSIDISYFNPARKAYQTEKTRTFTIDVAKGSEVPEESSGQVRSYSKEDVKVVGEDIRFIVTGNLHLKDKGGYFFLSLSYWLWLLIPVLLFASGSLLYRRRRAESADIVRVRNRVANKMAKKRLKLAEKAISGKNTTVFYQETLNALWGYVSYKLNIDSVSLTRDNINEILTERGVDEKLISEFIALLDKCEFARYAPAAASDVEIRNIYNSSLSVITDLEKVIK